MLPKTKAMVDIGLGVLFTIFSVVLIALESIGAIFTGVAALFFFGAAIIYYVKTRKES